MLTKEAILGALGVSENAQKWNKVAFGKRLGLIIAKGRTEGASLYRSSLGTATPARCRETKLAVQRKNQAAREQRELPTLGRAIGRVN